MVEHVAKRRLGAGVVAILNGNRTA